MLVISITMFIAVPKSIVFYLYSICVSISVKFSVILLNLVKVPVG